MVGLASVHSGSIVFAENGSGAMLGSSTGRRAISGFQPATLAAACLDSCWLRPWLLCVDLSLPLACCRTMLLAYETFLGPLGVGLRGGTFSKAELALPNIVGSLDR